MRTTERSSSWPKKVARKWLNIKGRADEFHSDHKVATGVGGAQARRKSCSDTYMMSRNISPPVSGGWLVESSESLKPLRYGSGPPSVSLSPAAEDLRMFVGTWNVGGRDPGRGDGLNLRDWLMNTPTPADIYVIGFQEIVPLNAGNVLGAEDRGPAHKWLSLIRRALNPRSPAEGCSPATESGVVHPVTPSQTPTQKPRVSFSDLLSMECEESQEVTESNSGNSEYYSSELTQSTPPQGGSYRIAASKQMVGIFLCVWVRSDLLQRVSSIKVSCVGRGIMGYMGNKGSISISMTVARTTFCFVCTHLASGEKDGDELRRNSDVVEILKRTRFPQSDRLSSQTSFSPDTILEHDRIIWLGDLNYRLVTSCGDTDELLQKSDWQSLLEKDQLRIEHRAGRVFDGWNEGLICFPPTYKYLTNSDRYAVNPAKPREKRRTPAWCDRILWRGERMKQMWYTRGESRFSDHRPVSSLFSVQLEANALPTVDNRDCQHCAKLPPNTTNNSNNNNISSNSSWGRVQAEELLLITRTQSCLNASRF